MPDSDVMVPVQQFLPSAAAEVAGLYLEVRKSIEDQVKGFAAPTSDKLLPDLLPQERHVFTLVLDLNETLVYSDWTRDRGWRTFKRPGAEAFLEHLAQFYEIVIYTDQLSFIVDPILEKLDQKGCIRYRLTREATQYIHGKHFKDLSKLNRDPAHVMFLSAHAKETCLQPENAVPVKPWKLESEDTMLWICCHFLNVSSCSSALQGLYARVRHSCTHTHTYTHAHTCSCMCTL
ncbi:hypothetical protein KP509_1Z324100 [Ceratopteris richardii]|nr:hypothetical protein KP509_1Z324100 [Ceratopteris richardii]